MVVAGGLTVTTDAAGYGAQVLTEVGQAKLARYLAAPVGKPASAAPVAVEEPLAPELPREVKVGRWTFPVVSIADDGTVTYRDRQGAEKTTAKGVLVPAA